jgi:hypothetical protein
MPGSDILLPESFMFLDEIVRLTEEFPYDLSIEGHTDTSPIATERFPSNWHLSAARAIGVLQYMVNSGGLPPEKLSAAGFARTRPLVDADTTDGRATNRRVAFVYLRDPKKMRESRAQKKAREANRAATESPPPQVRPPPTSLDPTLCRGAVGKREAAFHHSRFGRSNCFDHRVQHCEL